MPDAGAQSGDNLPGFSPGRLLLATVAAITLAAGEELLDPFGLDSESDRLSENIFNTITSPFYGASDTQVLEDTAYDSRFGQSNIVVLLIDDAYLDNYNREWPLRPREYRNMLRKLVDADAAVVFVDIFFRQDNLQRSQQISRLFSDASCMQAEAAGPVVNENYSWGDPAAPSATPQPDAGTAIYFAGTLQSPVPVALDRSPPASTLAAMASRQNIYNLQDTAIDGRTYDTAGWALYKAWCKRTAECDSDLDNFPRTPMYLHWGYAPNRMLTDADVFGAQQCRPQANTFAGRLFQSFRIFGWNLVKGFSDSRIAPCPYHTQIKLPLFNALSQDELRELFADKVVLIGASLQNYPDYQWSPVHDYIPGVFWHAMAVDNLMEFGRNYRKDPDEFLSNNFEVLGIVMILSLHGVITGLIQYRNARNQREASTASERQRQERGAIQLDLVHGLLTICVIAATVLMFTGVRNWSPANWIGFAMLMLLIDYKPVTSLGRFCWHIYPTARLSKRSFRFWMFKMLSWITVVLALIPAFLLFVLPHALLLGRYVSDSIGSVIFMSVYAVIIIGCLTVIVRETSS